MLCVFVCLCVVVACIIIFVVVSIVVVVFECFVVVCIIVAVEFLLKSFPFLSLCVSAYVCSRVHCCCCSCLGCMYV